MVCAFRGMHRPPLSLDCLDAPDFLRIKWNRTFIHIMPVSAGGTISCWRFCRRLRHVRPPEPLHVLEPREESRAVPQSLPGVSARTGWIAPFCRDPRSHSDSVLLAGPIPTRTPRLDVIQERSGTGNSDTEYPYFVRNTQYRRLPEISPQFVASGAVNVLRNAITICWSSSGNRKNFKRESAASAP